MIIGRRNFLAGTVAASAAVLTGCAGTQTQQAGRSRRNDGAASLARPRLQWQGKECRGWEQADFEALLRDRARETRRARR